MFIEGDLGKKRWDWERLQVIYKQKNSCEGRSVRVRVVRGGERLWMCDRYQQKKKFLSRERARAFRHD